MTDIKYIFAFSVMFAFAGALALAGTPSIFLVMNTFDLAYFASEISTITTACVVITGVPCAGVFAFWTVANLLTYVLSGEILTLIFFSPLFVVLIYILAKLARGNN